MTIERIMFFSGANILLKGTDYTELRTCSIPTNSNKISDEIK